MMVIVLSLLLKMTDKIIVFIKTWLIHEANDYLFTLNDVINKSFVPAHVHVCKRPLDQTERSCTSD